MFSTAFDYSSVAPVEERCGSCNKTPAETTDPKITSLLVCGQCRIEKYCGRACQKKDWPNHRYLCIHSKTKKLKPDGSEFNKLELNDFEDQKSVLKKLATIDKEFRRESINFGIDLELNSSSDHLGLDMATSGMFDMVAYGLYFDHSIENDRPC